MFWLKTTTAVVCTQMAANDRMSAKMTLFWLQLYMMVGLKKQWSFLWPEVRVFWYASF